jgi:hypothetical protein
MLMNQSLERHSLARKMASNQKCCTVLHHRRVQTYRVPYLATQYSLKKAIAIVSVGYVRLHAPLVAAFAWGKQLS